MLSADFTPSARVNPKCLIRFGKENWHGLCKDSNAKIGTIIGRLHYMRFVQIAATAALLAAPLAGHAGQVGPLSFSSQVGGAPTGVSYANFNNLPVGDTTGGSSGGIGVAFTGGASVQYGVVQGTSGYTAAPYFSNGNGALFGTSADGRDPTPYISTGIGSATFTLPGTEHYLGLLWGSVDSYNTLSFYDGTSLIGTLTGANVAADPNGNQGPGGTYYVNVNASSGFNRVVASSSQYAMEVDNMAYNSTPVPEPGSLLLLGTGLIGVALVVRKSNRSKN